ncbi:MAG: hypothetical protein ACAH59_04700 [Pseudobdellovibrionaceae bacterium]
MKKWIWLLVFLISPWALAQKTFLERTYEGRSKEKNPLAARQEILNQAIEKTSEEMIKEIIGDAKYARNKSLIQSKIIKNSARYIPFSKPGEIENLQPEGFKMTAILKVSLDDLQALLLENGLFYESDSTPIVLPAIRFLDRVNSKSFAWWAETDISQKAFLLKQGRNLENVLKSAFLKHNFYSLKPQSLKYSDFLPSSAKSESVRNDNWQGLAQKLGAQVLLDGEVEISKSQERSDAYSISLQLTATQLVNSRVIAEVSRKFETESGAFEAVVDRKLKEVVEATSQDLASQMFEAWQKGALGASLYRLTLRGRLPMTQQEAFKEALKNKVREVKNVRERLISTDSIVYEIDSALGPKELSQKASEIDLKGTKIVVDSVSDKEVVYRLAK